MMKARKVIKLLTMKRWKNQEEKIHPEKVPQKQEELKEDDKEERNRIPHLNEIAQEYPGKKEATTKNKTNKSKLEKAITNKQQKQEVKKNPPYKHKGNEAGTGIINPPPEGKTKERKVKNFIGTYPRANQVQLKK